ncbi:hypothetical protein SELMODRAFT_438290 [Selaginella moellendorffii]|uniref:MACPF domain-containing protein n=1 Tax=Selaginella moellendorffii TaxID=88036 RepID=D8QVS3_SELML|nr:DELTA-alicitoxin-Pse2b [Selaginella moellendorffii]EFJ36109.1 hypothetical protein SELMODRAFT_438290 [Selaginella moellendorffii]|eukprot:XP_002962646.1 DELTA-alicitoxin-Pse2b [Selaginella moellendorffii]
MASSGIFFFVLFVLYVSTAAAQNVHFGYGVYLPTTDLGSPLRTLRPIFNERANDFLLTEKYTSVTNNHAHTSNNQELYRSFGVTFAMNVPIKVLQLNIEASFNKIAGSKTSVKTTSVFVESYNQRIYLRNHARTVQTLPLNSDFLSDLRNLPEPPNSDSAWGPYRSFLNKWGTHYVSETFHGSWLRQWTVASSTATFTQRQMQAKACAKLTGLKGVLPNLEGCAGITLDDMRAAERIDTQDTREARGGSSATVSQLLSGNITNDLIRKFIEEGATSKEAVRYGFVPVWVPVLSQYMSSASKEWRVATALQAYYEGFLAFKCPLERLNTPATVLQQFRRHSNGKYQCVRQCQGCRLDKDCNLSGASGCYCYGNSCINALGPDGRAQVQPQKDNLDRNVLPNRSCEYNFPQCRCNTKSKEPNCGADNMIPIWDQGQNSIAIDSDILLYDEE